MRQLPSVTIPARFDGPGSAAHPLKSPLRAAFALSVGLSLSACGPAQGDGWFPLDPGHRQTYQVRHELDGVVRDEVWTQTVRDAVTWDDAPVAVRHHSAGVEFYLKASDAGVQRVAVRADVDDEPQADDPPRWVLKAPYTVGTEWSTPTVPYLLERRNEYPRELRLTHRLNMQWRIAAVDDAVDTPAGRFQPCLRVEGVGQLNLYTDPVNGFSDVPITGREWYCRGVGLVKWERRETVPSGFFMGGVVSAELLR